MHSFIAMKRNKNRAALYKVKRFFGHYYQNFAKVSQTKKKVKQLSKAAPECH